MADGARLTGSLGTAPSMPCRRRVASLLHRLSLLPPSDPASPVAYSFPLVAYVSTLVAAAIAVLGTIHGPPADASTLVLGCVVVACLAGYSVRNVAGLTTTWSAAVFVHLGVSILLGPIGAAAAAVVDAAAKNLRYRLGWLRFAFNCADQFFADLSAWGVFTLIAPPKISPLTAVATLAAGATQFLVNYGLLGVVVRISSGMPIHTFARRNLELVPYSLGYGFSAFAFVVLYRDAGTLGFLTVLTPVILLQIFLIVLARRVYQHDLENKANQEARIALLQRAIDASTEERERIAASIHDGIVQDLVGLSFTLSAHARMEPHELTTEQQEKLIGVLDTGASTVRDATRDLRTLMIDIASPKLKQAGLRAALSELLQNVPAGTVTKLVMPKDLVLNTSLDRLVFRVAQEALRNCVKYAQAQHITVSISAEAGTIQLRVVDDGHGFSTANLPGRQAEGHVGLALLGRTVGDGGGTLIVESQPEQGTTLTMTLPWIPGTPD